ncbi:hypothetical protein ILUMI_08479 [Ignelater luminosus]|uniref:RRM domain-containing protein n=1 Tax=Ignelater luminosus TaxID=2038154 RepID=A0A8K0DB67_IGNLU|nr:hypothetical protein ILUMI_08479 [Ignelater luminosus]
MEEESQPDPAVNETDIPETNNTLTENSVPDTKVDSEKALPSKPEKEQLNEFTVIDVDDSGDAINVIDDMKQESKQPTIKEEDVEVAQIAEAVNNEIKQESLEPDSLVLQLDASDALDSSVNSKPLKDNSNNTNKENVITTEIKPADTEKVCDSLILTVDDELETEEISLVEKNGKKETNSSVVEIKIRDTENQILKNCDSEDNHGEDIIKDDVNESETNKTACNSFDTKGNLKKPSSTNSSKANAGNPSRILWVSNVTQSIRASELKQYISNIGKVVTAKIVTDGKKCYGYIVMDNAEDASKCIKNLNNAYFEGRKLTFSFTRPQKSGTEKKEDQPKSTSESGKLSKSTKKDVSITNDTDEAKLKSKTTKAEMKRKRPSCSRSPSNRITKRLSSHDPLTTKFDFETKGKSRSRRTSRSTSRYDRREYVREKEERDRLKRRLLEEQRRNRDEMIRQIQREEKHREMEFKLEQERRKLQLERELFEKERRELTRLDAERRKIERERLEVLQQRSKLQEEIQKTRMKTKSDEFSMSSVIAKPPDGIKRKESSKGIDDDYRKSNAKNLYQKPAKENRDERNISNENKNSTSNRRSIQKGERIEFQSLKEGGKNLKTYERPVLPPPPKLTNDFDLSTGRKNKHSDRKHQYPDTKSGFGERKSERGGRKIEVIDRKFYPERSNEISERKHDRIYRKPEFEDRKMFPERKYEYGRDAKRYRDEPYSEREAIQRPQWPAASVNYNDQWKSVPQGPLSGSAGVRYQDTNFPASSYGGPSRMPPFYFHPGSTVQEFQRYDHCSQVNGRKYN